MIRPNDAFQLISNPGASGGWLASLNVRNIPRAQRDLQSLASRRIPADLLAMMLGQLGETLPVASDPDMALNNFERFFMAARSGLSLAALFEREPSAIPVLIRIFSTSQYLSDLLIRDGESYDALRLNEGQPIARDGLVEELREEIQKVTGVSQAMNLLRTFKQRQTLRVAYGDIVGHQQIDVIAAQISYIADAICSAAVDFCQRQLMEKFGRREPNRAIWRRLP